MGFRILSWQVSNNTANLWNCPPAPCGPKNTFCAVEYFAIVGIQNIHTAEELLLALTGLLGSAFSEENV